MSLTDRDLSRETTVVADGGAFHVRFGEASVFGFEVTHNGRSDSRRTFVGAVPAGGIIFGSQFDDGEGRLTLSVSCAQGALETISLEDMRAADRDRAVREHLNLIFGERPEVAERESDVVLPLGREEVDVPAGARVLPSTPIAYVRLIRGKGVYFGVPIDAGDVIAISPQHGLRATEPSTIASLGRPEDVATIDVHTALHLSAQAMWNAWRASAKTEGELRRERQAATRMYDDAALRHALSAATHALDSRAPSTTADDPIVAAAEIVARAYGITIEAPRRHYPDPHAMMRAIGEASRVPIRRVALRGRWWHREQGPLVGFSEGHAIALLPVQGGRRYVAIDPESPSVQKLVDDALAARIESSAYVFIRTFPTRPIDWRDLIRMALPGSSTDLIHILAFGFVAGLLGAVSPIAVGLVYGAIIPNGLRSSVWLIVAGLILVGFTAIAVDISRNLLVLRFQTRASGSVQAAVMARLLDLPAAFFRKFAVGDLADRALAIEAIQSYVTGATLSVVLGALFSVSSFGVVAYYDIWLAAICGLIAVVVIGAAVVQALLMLPLYRELSMRGGSISAYTLQVIAGIAKLRVSRAESRAFVGWLERFVAIRRLTARAGTIAYRFGIFQSLMPGVATLIIVAEIALFRRDTISAAAFLAISSAFGGVLGTLLALGDALSQIFRVVPIYERAKPVLDAVPEVHEGHGDPGLLSGAITLRRVAFSYDHGRRILDQVDLSVERGEFVAIVGPSGSGKSTLFRLLLGFEQPEEGAILYDGHDLASLDLGAVRRQIGCVLQTAKTIPGSIFENIACGTILTHDQAWEAARSVGLATDIAKLPMRMETVIGDDGGGLSGGQRQRILIARAIAHKPRIILFDEATSALDNQTQAIVTEHLQQLRVTRVVIAHRLSTIVRADRIIVLDRGRIAQQGTYEELVAAAGPFADLASRQRL